MDIKKISEGGEFLFKAKSWRYWQRASVKFVGDSCLVVNKKHPESEQVKEFVINLNAKYEFKGVGK